MRRTPVHPRDPRARSLLQVIGRPDLGVELGPARAVNGVTRRLSSIEAAGQQLGWKPEVDLHSGLRELVAWWRSERSEGVGS